MSSIEEVVNQHMQHLDAHRLPLIAALVAREQAMADQIRQAGMMFGLYPQIVAEVLAEIEMGEPITSAQRQMVHAQFNYLMSQIERAQRGEGPMPNP